jgi:hypothetical protein
MLPDRSRELLTAYVDGELTPRQLRHVERLLEESAAARELLGRLQEDAARLHGLNPPALDRDLSDLVVNAIRERRLQPGRRRHILRAPADFSTGALLAAAASVLLLVGMSAYLFTVVGKPEPVAPAGQTAEKDPKVTPPGPNDTEPAGGREEKPTQETTQPKAPRVARGGPDGRPLVGPPAPQRATTTGPPAAEAPVTDRMPELFQPERVEVTLPVVLPLADLSGEAVRGKLLAELRKDSAFRIELPCRNAGRAFDRVQAALRTRDFGLVIDQDAQARLRQPLLKTNYIIFAEDVASEDLAAVLYEANVLDHKGKPSEAQLAHLVLTRLSKEHHKQLSDLLGVDPISVPPRPAGPLGMDPHKPLTELTAGQVADALSGTPAKGATSGSGAARPPSRQALALAYNPVPVRPRAGSPEVRRFLDARKPARAGTLQILLILRGE